MTGGLVDAPVQHDLEQKPLTSDIGVNKSICFR